ncbi:DNA alkylation repair protein [Bacteroidota bacterium]
MANKNEIIKKLQTAARPDQLEGMARFGISINKRLGVSVPELRKIAKEFGKDHELALQLWETGIPEAKIIAILIDEIDKLTNKQMEDWVLEIDSWDVCDQLCSNLFEKAPNVMEKIYEWAEREEEYVKRAAFVIIACMAVHNKKADDKIFIDFFPLLLKGSVDERNFVKKAVNWAIRSIGKKNLNLNKLALKLSEEIKQIDTKAARWIAKDAIRELESEAVQKRLAKNK